MILKSFLSLSFTEYFPTQQNFFISSLYIRRSHKNKKASQVSRAVPECFGWEVVYLD